MSCIVNLFDQVIIGESSGGTLEYQFYDSNQDGLPDNGGSVIIIDINGNVDFNGAIPGDYYFRYYGGVEPCDGELIFFIRVGEGADAGIGTTIDRCLTDDPVNVFSLINGTPDTTGTWSGSGTQSAGWTGNADPTLVTFDPSLVVVGVYEFTYTVGIVPPEGFNLAECENCDPVSTTVTINVIDCSEPPPCGNPGQSASVSVCSGSGCTFDLFDQLGGLPDPGGQWTQLSGPAAIIPSGGDNGTVNFNGAPVGVYQFAYDFTNVDPECNQQSIVTVQVIAQPWAGNNGVANICESSGSVNLFTFLSGNPNVGGTWTLSPALPFGTMSSNGFINPEPGDAGVYVATYTVSNPVNGPCGTVCSDTSTVTVTITENCIANNGSFVICQTTGVVTLQAPVLMPGSTGGGTWGVAGRSANCNNQYSGPAIFSVNGAPPVNHYGQTLASGSVLSQFSSLGCYLFIYTCSTDNPACNDQSNFVLQVIDCTPECNSEVDIQAANCNLSILSLTNCPNPVYQWQVFTSGTWVAAPPPNNGATYTGIHNQTYRLRVTGCPNCPAIYSNQITVSCPPAQLCTITCSLTYNISLQRLQGVITNSGTIGGSMPYQFNRANNNTPNCNNCGGWQSPSCSGNVVIPAGPGGTVQVNCNVLQTAEEQCFRFVVSAANGPCNNTICCVKIPAYVPPNSFKVTFPNNQRYVGITIDGVLHTFGSTAPFNCTDYLSTQQAGNMNGIINCSMAQLVHDINQKLVALGKIGSASLWQGNKSSEIRVRNTNAVMNSMSRLGGGTDPFVTVSTVLCDDTTNYHFQGFVSYENFQGVVGVNGYLNPSVGGTFNLFTLLDLFFGDAPVELPHTGTFTAATCGSTAGCIAMGTNCCSGGAPPVTVHPTSGLVTWVPFTVPAGGSYPLCYWGFTYLVTLPNGCQECINMTLGFNDSL